MKPADGGRGAEETRSALVRAALRLFGAQGFDATSTRQIAAAAGANIGSIAYHFGGKEGLRLAVADNIVATMTSVVERAAQPDTAPANPDAAHDALRRLLRTMLTFIVARPEAGEVVQFVLRELSSPTAALDRIYEGVFEPAHKRACALWGAATGQPPEDTATKLSVFTMIGQAVYFRIGREAVMRRMGWTRIDKDEAAEIVAIALRNLDAAIESARRGQ